MTQPAPNDPMREAPAEDEALAHAQRFLAGEREGVLAFEDNQIPVKFVTDNATGRLIASVPVATFFAAEHVLFVPDESDDALQLLISPQQIDESASTDRWLAYHGEPEHVRWADIYIDSARHGPWVFDGDALAMPNPLASDEPRLVKQLNADKEALAKLCKLHADTEVAEPTCVGVDPGGLHVRARFGVLRIEFDHPAPDPQTADQTITRLLEST